MTPGPGAGLLGGDLAPRGFAHEEAQAIESMRVLIVGLLFVLAPIRAAAPIWTGRWVPFPYKLPFAFDQMDTTNRLNQAGRLPAAPAGESAGLSMLVVVPN